MESAESTTCSDEPAELVFSCLEPSHLVWLTDFSRLQMSETEIKCDQSALSTGGAPE